MRSILTLAGPVNSIKRRFTSLEDDEDAQYDLFTKFSDLVLDLTESKDLKYEAIDRLAYNQPLSQRMFRKQVDDDVAYAIFSVAFVFIYIIFHLESFFLALISMVLILMSFPFSYLIYTGIFQITLNTTLNQLTIFIVLGIAADDIFVFCDAWRQSANIPSIANE